MAVKKLSKEKMGDVLAELGKFRLIAPAKSDEVVIFKEIQDPGEVFLDYGNSTVPPKKMVFPQTETLFRFQVGKPELAEKNVEEEGTTVIFGLRPCDARAMSIVDKLFGWDYDDPYYQKRRELTTLVGMACVEPPSINCFCTSVGGSPFGTEGLDMMLTDLSDDNYLVRALTEKGEKLQETLADYLGDAGDRDEKKAEELASQAEDKIKRSIDPGGIPDKLPQLWEHELWKRVSDSCLGCGICTFLCPTCHCFDIQDEVEETGEGRRARMWDSCMFSEYTVHASGHNPRPTRKERTRNRINHKYSYYPERFDVIACVGCGRCINLCPVNIDILDILEQVVEA
ncbi:MAG: 4Fe-4S dicluster domain-containing protein [Actinomycetota bacterium]|nr:4Fe-4S dicluster domain-containing protein [Actinomycetota bacterium]